jgi:lysophospholipase L1-like esterase
LHDVERPDQPLLIDGQAQLELLNVGNNEPTHREVNTMKQHRLILLLLALAATLLGPPAALAEHEGHAVHYYVAVGDSLGAGPERGGDVNDYPEQLLVSLQQDDANLRLVRFGCGGESTTSMISAGLRWEGRGERYFCSYPHGSQLADAVRFLEAHRQFVSLVTIGIGGNDVLPCMLELDQTCLAEGVAAIEQNLPLILSALRAAAGADVPIVGMNYYNPFLALWFTSPAFAAAANQVFVQQLSPALAAAYADAGEPFANVETAFSTTDWTLEGGVPLNVVRICEWTQMCTGPFGPQSVHPNAAGHTVIANEFLEALP